MKKYLILLTLLVSYNCFGQSGWFWQEPKPLCNKINSGMFLNSNTVYLACTGRTLMKSTDAGVTWTSKNIIMPNGMDDLNLVDVYAVSENNLRVYSTRFYHGTYYMECCYSNDGGNVWGKSIIDSSYPQQDFGSIKFTDANSGWVYSSTYSKVFRTTNGGVNWQRYSINGVTNLNQLFFLNNNTGWIGNTNQYFKTTNGGSTWSAYTNNNFLQPFFINENTGWLNGGLYKTTNGGINYFVNAPSGGGFQSYYFENENTGWANNLYQVYRTTNSGTNWTLSYSVGSIISSNAVYNSGTAIYFGTKGYMARSSNYGANWTKLSSSIVNYDDFLSVSFVNENTGWAATGSKIFKTTTGGNTWFSQDTSIYFFHGLKFVNANTGYCVYSNKIKRTTNGGNTWSDIYTSSTFSSLSCPSANTAYFLDPGDHKLIKTTDGGNTFTTKSLYVFNYSTVQFFNDNTGYVTGEAGFLKTTNGGDNWILPPNDYFIENSYFINEQTGFNFGYYRIDRTSNGGANWTRIINEGNDVFYSMEFVNSLTGWAAGETNKEGLIMKTTDGGITWKGDNNITPDAVLGISFINSNTGWAVGSTGSIIKTITGGSIGVQQISSEIPDNFSLSQNYQNPFNPNTVISYKLSAAGIVSLRVFDLLGKEVATLVNEKQSAGSYTVDFNSAEYNLPSGIYFYALNAGDFKETRKMVLVK